MTTPMQGKVALITGGSKGIGRATCIALAKLGASLVITYSSDASAADELVKQLGADKAIAVKADAGSIEGAEKTIQAAIEKFGRLDVVIPNAASRLLTKGLEDTSEEDFEDAYRVNVKGPYFLIQKALPHLKEGARIVMLSTTQCHASTVTGNYLLYCSTKGAIEQMVKILAKALGPKGISVNAIAPGPTGTDFFLADKSEQALKAIAGFSPQNRIGQPDEIADAIAFMSSPASRWVSGQILAVNGGMAFV